MRILLFADGRSPHTIGWLRGMRSIGLEVSFLSSKAMSESQYDDLNSILGDGRGFQPRDPWSKARPTLQKVVRAAVRARRKSAETDPSGRVATPRTIDRIDLAASLPLALRIRSLIRSGKIDAVHALRVQIEGIVATRATRACPLAISTWGQDLTSPSSMGGRFADPTRIAMRRADLFFADCERDINLAPSWGLRPEVNTYQLPGNFGVDLESFPSRDMKVVEALGARSPIILYPRGLRGFVNHVGFIQAAIELVQNGIEATFIGVGLSSSIEIPRRFVRQIVVTENLTHQEMLKLVACADVVVSPASSDGMPNSVLEGLAAGAIPVCGEIDSLKELEALNAHIAWCDPLSSSSIGKAILEALSMCQNPRMREQNKQTIRDHYSLAAVKRKAVCAYEKLESLI